MTEVKENELVKDITDYGQLFIPLYSYLEDAFNNLEGKVMNGVYQNKVIDKEFFADSLEEISLQIRNRED